MSKGLLISIEGPDGAGKTTVLEALLPRLREAYPAQVVTTREPGAKEVLICGFTFRPAFTAFFARRPAASNTLGFEVFVHEVIAAIATAPSGSEYCCPFSV